MLNKVSKCRHLRSLAGGLPIAQGFLAEGDREELRSCSRAGFQGDEVKLDICGTKQFHPSPCYFFLIPFCLQVFPQTLRLQTATARYRLNKSVSPGGWSMCLYSCPSHISQGLCVIGTCLPSQDRLSNEVPLVPGLAFLLLLPETVSSFPSSIAPSEEALCKDIPTGFLPYVIRGRWRSTVGIRPEISTQKSGPARAYDLGSCFRLPARGVWGAYS